MCFKDNRATLHLHGGITPWISDGTPHQWITPASETTAWPQGVSVENVPDMDVCRMRWHDDGCMTFYYTNQQSARLMFYHDHAWGITRLNVYAGEAAGYLITDDTEKALISQRHHPGCRHRSRWSSRTRPSCRRPQLSPYDAGNVSYGQDPTWDTARWGGYGNFWYHHVYMPAQNPGDPGGMSAYGRWMYGPWFWPPAANTVYGPIANPYYNGPGNGSRRLAVLQPGRPGHLAVPDRPVLRAAADPRHAEHLGRHGAVQRHADRQRRGLPDDHPRAEDLPLPHPERGQRPLLQLPVVRGRPHHRQHRHEPGESSATEVALNPAELAAAQTDPVVFPTPVQSVSHRRS